MALATFLPDPPPSLTSKREIDFKIFEAEFGNGYKQRTLDGTNPRRDKWTLIWTNLSKDEADAIENFMIETKCVTAFYWLSPRDTVTKKWTVQPKWERTQVEGDTDTFQCVIIQDFTLVT
ncbi:phage tail protein [Roseococcus pinisoli]|uniref:Phage tail protein n=1 Tax=Roseococcus pinisoli TaxID=2835040 RepID=A0ABS5QHB4_9PROT|nr:phage tail protein [Roseococcus pinisoli]MBS7812345.1 phage tail protein [Roseococcus pinisoli]